MHRKTIYTAIGAVALGVTLLTQFLTVTPGQSIQSAVNAASAGDTITIEAGTYAEQVTVSKPLTLQAQGVVKVNGFIVKADDVTIQGFDITSVKSTSNGFGVRVYNARCKILNNYIHDTWLDGVLLEKSSTGCLVADNKMERTSQSGAEVRGSYHIIRNNEVVDTIQSPPGSGLTRNNFGADADGFRFFGNGHQFIGNYIHDIKTGTATNPDPHTDCFQSWKDSDVNRPNASNISFRDNTCFVSWDNNGNSSSKMFQFGAVSNSVAENNASRSRMVAIVQDGSHDIQFVHNTFIGDGSLSWGIEINSGVYNITARDNVFFHQENGYSHFIWKGSSGLNIGHNCVKAVTKNPPRPADPGDVWGRDANFASYFVDYANDDLHFLPTSPCLGFGAFYEQVSVTVTPTPAVASITPSVTLTPIPVTVTPTRTLTPTQTPSRTPIPATFTATRTLTPTASSTSTITPTAMITVTPECQYFPGHGETVCLK